MSLDGKVALVTGASRGIGRDIALAVAGAGAKVACLATSEQNAQHTVNAVRAVGGTALAIGARVQSAADVTAAFDRVEQELGPVDVLVNNAGIIAAVSLLDITEAQWDEVMDVNAKGTYLCAQQAARRMVARGAPGAIINLGSVGGTNGFPNRFSYGASKAAVHQMTKQMAIELAEKHIRVNCVAPGIIATDMIRGHIEAGRVREEDYNNRIPQRHMGEGMDIGQAVVFLASEQAKYITGIMLPVDGGFLAYGFL
jgi:NAD(P)-dependent dehydrogenase (short-subunit alcohol dehydrogenase family)